MKTREEILEEWEQKATNNLVLAKAEAASLVPGANGQDFYIAPEAIKKVEQEQEDTRNAPREQREIDMEKHARHTKWAVWATVPISLIALGVSIWVAFVKKG